MRSLTKFEDYDITEEGKVYRKGREIKTRLDRYGYPRINIYNDGKMYVKHVHRLVADKYLPPIEGTTQLNHKDGNKLNTSKDNLERVTGSENIKHALKLGLQTFVPRCTKNAPRDDLGRFACGV